jgi:integrase
MKTRESRGIPVKVREEHHKPRHVTLTVRYIETIKPTNLRREIPDALLPGLYLVIQPSGAKSFAVRYRVGTRTRKYTLPPCDLKTARALAREALNAVAEGRDPGREKAQARSSQPDTVEAVARLFVERHVLRATRPRTAAETRRLLNTAILSRWGNRLLSDISRRDVRDLLDRIVDAGTPIVANRVLAAFSKLCNWAVEREIIDSSPCSGVKRPSVERARDRVLTDDELRDVWLAADQLGDQYGALIKLLILLGQRRSEVAGMRWSELDFSKEALWTLPGNRTKNGQLHTIPLTKPVLDVIAGLPRIGDEFVITATGAGPWRGYVTGKVKLAELLPPDMRHWTLHDLRRTAASGMARLGVALPVIEKVLNHSSGSFAGVVGIYQRHDYAAEQREALEIWARHVLALVEPQQRQQPTRSDDVGPTTLSAAARGR